MRKQFLAVIGWMFAGVLGFAQTPPFDVYLEPMSVPGLGGLQSYAVGQHDGKWLIVGGRLDGLHRRQPFAAFDVVGNNNQLIVVDPVAQQKWSAPITALPLDVQEQLSATNIEFIQEGNFLYIVGGYGFDAGTGTKVTFEQLTAINVPAVIATVMTANVSATDFRQISDPQFAVAGGRLHKINQTYYLVGGQRFDGDYNPMGHATYTQAYTNQVRKFNLTDNGTTIGITHLTPYSDANNLHRRDYNAVPQILPSGAEGITAFSGVFQPNVDLPYLNCVHIDSVSHAVDAVFQQYYNHYHCAVLPIYDATTHEMHNIFFGGIAQYYDSAGTLVRDDNVPFVRTIARVTRDAAGNMAEYKLPVEMPSLLGAGSELIQIPSVPQYANRVFNIDAFNSDTTLVGYIYGGISSTAANVFFTNTGTQSSASSQIFKVYVIQNTATGIHTFNPKSISGIDLNVFPNPSNGDIVVRFNMREFAKANLTIHNAEGNVVETSTLSDLHIGENTLSWRLNEAEKSGTYFLTIETPEGAATQKMVVIR